MEERKPTKEDKVVALFFAYMQTVFAIAVFLLSSSLVIAHFVKGNVNFGLLLLSAIPVIAYHLTKLSLKELKQEKIKYTEK